MYSLEQLKPIMRQRLEADRRRQHITTSGDTLASAVEAAATELNLSVQQLEYEVIDRGNRGMFGMGQRPAQILAYPATGVITQQQQQAVDIQQLEKIREQDGETFVRLTANGVMLKVTKPTPGRQIVNENMALARVRERTVVRIEERLLKQAVHQASGEWIRIGDYHHNPAADSRMAIQIASNGMKAILRLLPPQEGGADPSAEGMKAYLHSTGVVKGFLEDALQQLEDEPQYHEAVLVAEGRPARKGRDAEIVLNFDRDIDHSKVKIIDDRVDYKDLNLVQNVIEGQVLAKKYDPQMGEDGFTVTGEMLPAAPGVDQPLRVGKNVKLSADGRTATAAINGHVIFEHEKISVEPVYVVNGNVNLKTGNIIFLGSVMVKGNVEDGFSVKATGPIEVTGSVGKAMLESEDNIVVNQGIAGKGGAKIIAGKNLWAKFIENAAVECEGLIVVSDGIINSEVSTRRKVICRGRRANIVGGAIRAIEGIYAKVIGSVAGVETIVEVGIDPRKRHEYRDLKVETQRFEQELSEIRLNLQAYHQIKLTKRRIPVGRKEYYEGLDARNKELTARVQHNNARLIELQDHFSQISTDAAINVQQVVFPGVKIAIRDAALVMRKELKNISFILEDKVVKAKPYQQMAETVEMRKTRRR